MNTTTNPDGGQVEGRAPDPTVEELKQLRQSIYDDLLTYEQVCEVFDISRYTLSRWIADGVFSPARLGGRHYIPRAAIAAHIQRLRADTTARQNDAASAKNHVA